MIHFDLQRFGGKGGSSTTISSAPKTDEERRLEAVQANYAEQTAPTAAALQNKGSNMILNNPGVVPVDYTAMSNTAVSGAQNINQQLAGLTSSNATTNADYVNRYKDLTAGSATTNAEYQQKYNDLQNGILPASYLQNETTYLNDAMQGTIGNTLSGLGNRGILNSSVTSGAMDSIGRNINATVAGNYTNNLNTQNTLLNSGYNAYNTGYGNQVAGLGNEYNAYNTGYGNQVSGLNNQMSNLSQPMALANAAQNASIDIPSKILALSQGQQSDTSSLLNTLSSNRINDKTTTSTTTNGGILEGLLGGVGSYFGAACFVAGTKITTPTVDKNIEDIQLGDAVMNPDGEIETVTEVMKPCISPDKYLTVEGEHSKVTTTSTQEFCTLQGDFVSPALIGRKCITLDGTESVWAIYPAPAELVYDFKTTGSNTYYANGFLVRGRK